eukprot:SAG11_NODE_620_length_8171_cov_9.337339_4_plen_77_part_00
MTFRCRYFHTDVLALISSQTERTMLLAPHRCANPRLPILGFLLECATAAVRVISLTVTQNRNKHAATFFFVFLFFF